MRAVRHRRHAELARTGPRTGRSRTRCRGRRCRGGTAGARRRRLAERAGGRSPVITTVRNPSSTTACSSSADRHLGRAHGDQRAHGHAVAVRRERPGRSHWLTARAAAPPTLAVVEVEQPQRGRRVEDREVDAQLVEALVQQPGQVGGGPVEGVARLPPPPRGHGPPLPADAVASSRPARTVEVSNGATPPGQVPVAQLRPPTASRWESTSSSTIGASSTKCPSASMTGWSTFVRTSADLVVAVVMPSSSCSPRRIAPG